MLTLHLCAKELFAHDSPPPRSCGVDPVGSLTLLAVASFQKEPSVNSPTSNQIDEENRSAQLLPAPTTAYTICFASQTRPDIVHLGSAQAKASDHNHPRQQYCVCAEYEKMPKRKHIALVACEACRARKSRVRLADTPSMNICGKLTPSSATASHLYAARAKPSVQSVHIRLIQMYQDSPPLNRSLSN